MLAVLSVGLMTNRAAWPSFSRDPLRIYRIHPQIRPVCLRAD
jgi:hypothetical protein